MPAPEGGGAVRMAKLTQPTPACHGQRTSIDQRERAKAAHDIAPRCRGPSGCNQHSLASSSFVTAFVAEVQSKVKSCGEPKMRRESQYSCFTLPLRLFDGKAQLCHRLERFCGLQTYTGSCYRDCRRFCMQKCKTLASVTLQSVVLLVSAPVHDGWAAQMSSVDGG